MSHLNKVYLYLYFYKMSPFTISGTRLTEPVVWVVPEVHQVWYKVPWHTLGRSGPGTLIQRGKKGVAILISWSILSSPFGLLISTQDLFSFFFFFRLHLKIFFYIFLFYFQFKAYLLTSDYNWNPVFGAKLETDILII